MKKLLLSIAFVSMLVSANALSIALNAFEGSKLCNTLTLRYTIPDSLTGRYTYNTEIVVNETDLTFSVKHFLTSSATSDTLKEIVTDVNEYFETIRTDNNIWTVSQQLFINEAEITPINYNLTGNPFQDCYEYKRNCQSLTAYRKSLRKICSNISYFPKFTSQIIGDSVIVHFKDSTSFSRITCSATGNYVKTDSIQVNNLMDADYKVYNTFEDLIYCFTLPCPNPIISYNYLGNANNNCSLSSKINGSVLCNNLTYTYVLPDSLLDNYSYTVVVEKNSNTLDIFYYLQQSTSASNLTHSITTNLTNQFDLSYFNLKTNWKIVNHLNIHNKSYPLSEVEIDPFSTCYEVKSECEKVNVYRKSKREFCSTTNITTTTVTDRKEDILMVDFVDTFTKADAVCLAEGWLVHTDSVEFDNLTNKNYRVYVGKDINCVDGVCPFLLPAPTFLSFADLSHCVINGFQTSAVEQFIYPNPAKSYFLLDGFSGELELTNQLGQSFTLQGNESFSTENIPTGIYIATFERNGKTIREKIVIQ